MDVGTGRPGVEGGAGHPMIRTVTRTSAGPGQGGRPSCTHPRRRDLCAIVTQIVTSESVCVAGRFRPIVPLFPYTFEQHEYSVLV